MEEKQSYDDFVTKNNKEIEKKREMLKKQSEQECIICDQIITEISSQPKICKSCENKIINGEKLQDD
jgi:hypothetical protein